MFGEFLLRFPATDRTSYEARILHTALAWLQNANNRLLDIEAAAAAGTISAADAAQALPVARTTIFQIFALLGARYECLREQRTGRQDWAHTLEAGALQPAGPGWSNPATAAIHASAAAARFSAASRSHGQDLARPSAPRPPPAPRRDDNPGGRRPRDRRRRPRNLPNPPADNAPAAKPAGGRPPAAPKRPRSPGRPPAAQS